MTVTTNLDSLYSARPVALWVEDKLVKEYLSRIWRPENNLFQMLIAGSCDNVVAVVKDCREKGHKNVFGVVDRDFRNSNRNRWENPDENMTVYRPERMEIENYLLDWDALEGSRENTSRFTRSKSEIRRRALMVAKRMCYWMACRNVISDIHDRLAGEFPAHPKITEINSLSDAENYIKTARNWWERLPAEVNHITDLSILSNKLKTAYDHFKNDLDQEKWIENFSGKEILRNVRGFIINKKYAGNEVMDTDHAKAVAEWQYQNDSVPRELIELKNAILSRVESGER